MHTHTTTPGFGDLMTMPWGGNIGGAHRFTRTPRRLGLLLAIVLHAAAAALVLGHAPARTVLLEAAPIMVELITPPQPQNIQPAKTKLAPVAQPGPLPQPVEPPLIATTTPAPAPSAAVAPPPSPLPAIAAPAPVIAAPASLIAASAMVAAPATQPATPAPAQVTLPIFNAAYLDNPAPPYPPQSRRMHEQGRVILRVLVNAGGRAEEVQIRTGSGSARLDESARETVTRWKFVPAKRGGEAVPAWVLIPVSFRLDS